MNGGYKVGSRKVIASVVAAVLVLALVFSLLAGVLSAHASDKSKLNDLKSQLSGITKERKDISSQLKELNNQISTIMTQKSALERDINYTYEQIDLVNEIISNLDESIEKTTKELEAAEADEAEQYELFKKRLRAMYENDSVSTLELIFTAGSLTELLSRLEANSSITSYGKKIMEKLAAIRIYIEELKAGLESDKAENESYRADLHAYEADLVEQNKQLDFILLELEGQVDLAQAELDAVEAEEKAFEKEIAALAAKIKKEEDAAAAAKGTTNKYTGGTMTWPLPGYSNISSDYGMRYHPITGKYSQHTGIDIPAPKGTKIVAAQSGTVVTVGYNTAYGNRVVISHGGDVQTLYAHMSSFAVSENQTVKAGDVIGYVGSTGYSSGNHLHFSVLVNGSYVNPKPYVGA